MANIALVSAGAASSGTTTITPAYGQTPQAGNLLIAWVAVFGTGNSPGTPAGWTAWAGAAASTFGRAVLFYKIAAGNDAAPVFAQAAATAIVAKLAEFTGGQFVAVRTTGQTSSTSPKVMTLTTVDPEIGGLMVSCVMADYSIATSQSFTDTYNNGSPTSDNNNGVSTVAGYDFAWAVSTANAAADQDSAAFVTTNLQTSGMGGVMGLMRLQAPAPAPATVFSPRRPSLMRLRQQLPYLSHGRSVYPLAADAGGALSVTGSGDGAGGSTAWLCSADAATGSGDGVGGANSALTSLIATDAINGDGAGGSAAALAATDKLTGTTAGSGASTDALVSSDAVTGTGAGSGASASALTSTDAIDANNGDGVGGSSDALKSTQAVTSTSAASGGSSSGQLTTTQALTSTSAGTGGAASQLTSGDAITSTSAASGGGASALTSSDALTSTSAGTGAAADALTSLDKLTGTGAGTGGGTAAITSSAGTNISGTGAGAGGSSDALTSADVLTGTSNGVGGSSDALAATLAVTSTSAGNGTSAAQLTAAAALTSTSAGVGGNASQITSADLLTSTAAGSGGAISALTSGDALTSTTAGTGASSDALTSLEKVTGTAAGTGGGTAAIATSAVTGISGTGAGTGGSSDALTSLDKVTGLSGGTAGSAGQLAETDAVAGVAAGTGGSSSSLTGAAAVAGTASGAGGSSEQLTAADAVRGTAAGAGGSGNALSETSVLTGTGAGIGSGSDSLQATDAVGGSAGGTGASSASVGAKNVVSGTGAGTGSGTATILVLNAGSLRGSGDAVGGSAAALKSTARVTTSSSAGLGGYTAALTAGEVLRGTGPAQGGSTAAVVLRGVRRPGKATGTITIAGRSGKTVATITRMGSTGGISSPQSATRKGVSKSGITVRGSSAAIGHSTSALTARELLAGSGAGSGGGTSAFGTLLPAERDPVTAGLLADTVDLVYGSECGPWRYQGKPDVDTGTTLPGLITAADVSVIRWSMLDCFSDLVRPGGHGNGGATTGNRTSFDTAVNGFRNTLNATVFFKLLPNNPANIDGSDGTWFYPPLSQLDLNLPYSKSVIDQAGSKIRIYESSNEIEFNCYQLWGFASAGATGLGTDIGKHYCANMPALKKYARAKGFEIISVGYMGTAGGFNWGDSIATPRKKTCTEFMTEVYNQYVANGYDSDYIPDAMSFHAYPYGVGVGDGDFDPSVTLSDVISYYTALIASWRAECVRIWGSVIGNKIRAVCSEWNAGASSTVANTWAGFLDSRVDDFYTSWIGMLRSQNFWLANQFGVGTNASELTGPGGQYYDLVSSDAVTHRQYAVFKSLSLGR